MTDFIGGVVVGVLLSIVAVIVQNTKGFHSVFNTANRISSERGQIIETTSILDEIIKQQ